MNELEIAPCVASPSITPHFFTPLKLLHRTMHTNQKEVHCREFRHEAVVAGLIFKNVIHYEVVSGSSKRA